MQTSQRYFAGPASECLTGRTLPAMRSVVCQGGKTIAQAHKALLQARGDCHIVRD